MRENSRARLAAILLVVSLAVQFAGAALSMALDIQFQWAVGVVFYLICAAAALLLRAYLPLGAAVLGLVLCATVPFSLLGLTVFNGVTNLVYLALYLPMQLVFDERLRRVDASRATLSMGRGWSLFTIVSRAASLATLLPVFDGAAEQARATGVLNGLLSFQTVLEIVALLAALISYVFMIRYLWRAKALLNE